MSLYIYRLYQEQKKLNNKHIVKMTKIEESADEHRAKIVLSEMLKWIQQTNREEDQDISDIKLIDFMRHIQRRIGNINKSI